MSSEPDGLWLFKKAKNYEEKLGMKHYNYGPSKGSANHARVTARMKNAEWRKSAYNNWSKQSLQSNAASAELAPRPIVKAKQPEAKQPEAKQPKSQQPKKESAEQRRKQLNEEFRKNEERRQEQNKIGDLIQYCKQGHIDKVTELLESYHPKPHTKLKMVEMAAWFDRIEMLDFLLSHPQFQDENYVYYALLVAISSSNSRNTITHVLESWEADPSEITLYGRDVVVELNETLNSGEKVLDVIWDEERPVDPRNPRALSPYENKIWKEAFKLSCSSDVFGFIAGNPMYTQQRTLDIFKPLLEDYHMKNLNAMMYLVYMLNNIDPYDPYRYSPPFGRGDRERFLRIILPYVLDVLEEEADPYKKKKAATILYKKNYKEMTPEQKERLEAVLSDFRFMRNNGTKKNKLNLIERIQNIPLKDQNRIIVSDIHAKILQNTPYSHKANNAYNSHLPVEKMKKLPQNLFSRSLSFLTPKKGGRNKYKKTRKHRN